MQDHWQCLFYLILKQNRNLSCTGKHCHFFLKTSITIVEEAPISINNEDVCLLCGRPLAEPMNRHHLIPLSKGGRATPTIILHKICHSKVHAVLNEAELKRYYHTIERLREQEEIAKFIRWVQKRPPEFYDSSVKGKR